MEWCVSVWPTCDKKPQTKASVTFLVCTPLLLCLWNIALCTCWAQWEQPPLQLIGTEWLWVGGENALCAPDISCKQAEKMAGVGSSVAIAKLPASLSEPKHWLLMQLTHSCKPPKCQTALKTSFVTAKQLVTLRQPNSVLGEIRGCLERSRCVCGNYKPVQGLLKLLLTNK